MNKVLNAIKKLSDRQIVRFVVVGASNTCVSYITYLIVFFLSNGRYIPANIAGFITGTLNAYIWNSRFVFDREHSLNIAHLLKTFISYGATCLLNTALLWVLVEYFHVSGVVAPLINAALIFFLNFLLNKFWVYRKREEDK